MSRRGGLAVAGLVALAAAAAVVAALLLRDEGASSGGPVSGATLATDARGLAADAASVGHAVYWAGPIAGRRYELTRTTDGRAYVRYLPAGVEAGDPRPGFLTVGTYLLEDAFSVTRATGRRAESRAVRGPAKAVAFYSVNRPQSVYLAFRGSDLQIEVFHPSPRQARRLVREGRIRPVG